ncbi:MAG: ribonuclease R, partial [Phycisphaeraceae bacterium]
MPERYSRRILEHIADRRYQPRTMHQLADDLSIPPPEHDAFEQAVRELLGEGQAVLGSAETLVLPPPGQTMVGRFRRHERGFGFIIPDELTQHGDLFVPPQHTMDAMTGDRVRAQVVHQPGRGKATGKSPYTGKIVEIIQRADRQYVGTLMKRGQRHLVQVDGRILHEPVIVRDPHAKNARVGDKVVVELTSYPGSRPGDMADGVITEVIGEAGEPDVETQSIIRAYGLKEKFSDAVMDDARTAAHSFADDNVPEDREDLTDVFITTIDPPDAKDFDDAISIRRLDDGTWELGVHIADVAHFVQPGTALDAEAYDRGNSSYLPRKVVPMLPELLSNGVCSLQEGVNRFAKSCFIRYDEEAKVIDARFSRSVIRSTKRMTYLEAQALIDGDLREARKHAKTEPHYPKELVKQLRLMDELAKVIQTRRRTAGMISLELPEVELVFDESGRVVDAVPEDDAFTHTIIEMFMVEANEAAARLFDALDIPMIRRVHPDPDAYDLGELKQFARVAGYNIPQRPSRHELQQLLDSVRGKAAQHAVHLAVLRTLSKAEYAPLLVGHFALASEHYTHFTSPIRRYPDLVIHRGLEAFFDAGGHEARRAKGGSRRVARAMADDDRLPDEKRMYEIGKHCSTTERNSESAERELRDYLVMELLSEHLGEDYQGTVTGVTGTGLFVQIDRYLIDGLIRTAELPGADERWQLNPNTKAMVAQRSGRSITIGDRFVVRIANVDLGRRQMDLVIVEDPAGGKGAPGAKKGAGRKQPPGAAKAHQQTQEVKEAGKTERKGGDAGGNGGGGGG